MNISPMKLIHVNDSPPPPCVNIMAYPFPPLPDHYYIGHVTKNHLGQYFVRSSIPLRSSTGDLLSAKEQIIITHWHHHDTRNEQ